MFLRGSAHETLLCGNATMGRKVEMMPSKDAADQFPQDEF